MATSRNEKARVLRAWGNKEPVPFGMSWECMRGRDEKLTTRLENDLGGELVRTSQGARKVQSTGHAMRQSVRLLNRPAYRCRRRCLLPTGRDHLHNALQSHRLPFWFGLTGSISDTVRCRRGQLYLGMPDTYPCRAARLSRWFWGGYLVVLAALTSIAFARRRFAHSAACTQHSSIVSP